MKYLQSGNEEKAYVMIGRHTKRHTCIAQDESCMTACIFSPAWGSYHGFPSTFSWLPSRYTKPACGSRTAGVCVHTCSCAGGVCTKSWMALQHAIAMDSCSHFIQEQSWLKGATLVVARRRANFHHLAVFLSVAAIQIIAQANDRQHTVLSRSQGRQKGQNQTAEHQQLCSWHVDWAHLGRCQGAKVTSVNHEEYKIYILVNIPAWFRFTACHSQKKNSDRTARNYNCKLVVCRFNLKLTCTYSTFRHNRETNRLGQSQGESNYPYHVAFAASGSIVQVQMQWLSAYASSCSVLCLFVAAVE